MSSSEVKICLLGVEPTNSNLGVRALTAGSIACILHQYPAAEISLLDYAKEGGMISFRVGETTVPLRLVNIRFSKKFYAKNHIVRLIAAASLSKLTPTKKLRRALIRRNPWLQHIDDVDLVASIAGGDSFSDVYGLERLLYVSLPQILALWAGKRLILLPQTLGPFKSWLAQTIAKYIMKRAEAVYSRDHAGVKLGEQMLGANGDARKLRFCYDVGFALDPMPPQRVDVVGLELPPRPASRLVGLNVSGLLFMGGYSRRNMFGLKVEYQKLVYDLIDFLVEQKKANVLLVPHVFGQHNESDATVCGRLYEALKDKYAGKIGWVRGSYNQSEIKHVIGTCDFFIGSRMHACIAAISQLVPAVCIAYSDKFVGVMETIGIESMVADARRLSVSEILQMVEESFEHRAITRQLLKRKIPEVKTAVLNLFSDVPGETARSLCVENAGASSSITLRN